MYEFYDCQPILRMPTKVKIKLCICGEASNGMTLVLYCDNYHILVYHISKCHLNCDINVTNLKNNVIIRQIPVDKRNGELRSMDLNPNGSQLIAIDSNSHIFVIPVQRLIECQNECPLKYDAELIKSCSLSNPTAIIWWNSLDEYNQTAIVGNDFGEISFIDIKTKREIGGTYVQNSVKKLMIIDDKSSVSLIIYCKNNTEYRLILEEIRIKSVIKSRPESRLPTHEHYYFNCFITASEEREPIGPNNCWNFKPVLVDLFSDNNIQEKNEIIETTFTYQKPLILCFSEVTSDDQRFGRLIIRLITNKEFYYNLSAFFAKYSFPKYSSSPIYSVILTERLLFVCSPNNCVLISREFSDSRKLAKLNPIVQTFNFAEKEEQVINAFKLSVNDLNEEFLDSFIVVSDNCLYLCHQKESCHKYFHSIVSSVPTLDSKECILIMRAQRFASMFGLNTNKHFEKSAITCLQNNEFSSAVCYYQLAKMSQIKRVTAFVSFGFFSETIAYIQVLFSTKSYELEDSDRISFANIAVNCFVQQLLRMTIRGDEQEIENSFKTFLRDCLYYDERHVLQLLVGQGLYQLAHYCAQLRSQFGLLLHYLLESSTLRSKFLKESTFEKILNTEYKNLLLNTTENKTLLNCLTSPQITYSLILRKDLISKYLRFVVKLLPNLDINYLEKMAAIFDPRRSETQLLLNRVLTHLKQTYLNTEDIEQQIIQRKDVLNLFILIILMILRQNGSVSSFNPRFLTIDSFIKDIENNDRKQLLIETVGLSAGVSHSGYIRNGCLYMWGKLQFGCCGLSNVDDNSPKHITSPKRLDFFKEVVSISVKSVSCGSQHSLVLTDFGVYSFGSSRFGQLGLGKHVVLSRNPIIISQLVNKDIVKVECGQYHSLAVSSSGLLYTWGWNLFGQLGIANIEDAHTPQVVECLRTTKIIQAFGGFGHTIALDFNGFVYAFGSGSYGQLGMGTVLKQTIPQKISLLNEPIGRIVTKYFHCLALSRDNRTLYVWGTNPQVIRLQANYIRKTRSSQSNQLSETVYPTQDYLTPTKVDISQIDSIITRICVGSVHSLLLTANGKLYSFGRGIDGQLGHGKIKEVKTPAKIQTMDEIAVVDIATGSDFSLAMDSSGNIWGFGHNSDGQIGPISCSNGTNHQNCSVKDKNKKISIKTNRRLITFMSKCVEYNPIRIPFVDEIESYCDSLNYSLDIIAMKTSTRFSLIDDNMNALSNQNSVSFDRKLLSHLLAFYRQELDLYSIKNRFNSFKSHQMTAFVSEIQNDFPNAFDFQLQALQLSVVNDCNQFTEYYTKLFSIYLNKTLENVDKCSKVFDVFIKFWINNEFEFKSLEVFLEKCYKNDLKDSMFGISFFNYLKNSENIAKEFNSRFLLEMVDLTIKNITKSPENLFKYQTDIEKITSDIEEISFPAEKLWQNIMNYFESNKKRDSINSIEIRADVEEVVLFNCSHFHGINELKQTIVPNFRKDINELNSNQSSEIQSYIDTYNDWDKYVWDCVCPECLITQIKSKIQINS